MNDAEKRFWLEGVSTRFEELEKRTKRIEDEKKGQKAGDKQQVEVFAHKEEQGMRKREDMAIARHRGEVYVASKSLQDSLDRHAEMLLWLEECSDERWRTLKRLIILGGMALGTIGAAMLIVLALKWNTVLFIIKRLVN